MNATLTAFFQNVLISSYAMEHNITLKQAKYLFKYGLLAPKPEYPL
jgi:hypothetical protein